MHAPPSPPPRFRVAWIVFAASGVLFLGVVRARDDLDDAKEWGGQRAAAPLDVLDLADALDRATDDDIEARAKAIAANHDLASVSLTFKPRSRGGVGVGLKPGKIKPDGIELKLISLWDANNPTTEKQMREERADLIRMAKVMLAVAEVTPFYASKYTKTKDEAKSWLTYSDDLKRSSRHLIDALEREDIAIVELNALIMHAACNDCHRMMSPREP